MIRRIQYRLLCVSLLIVASLFSGSVLYAQDVTSYPDIPRIDVHTHIAEDVPAIRNYLKMRDLLKQEHQVDLAMWIDLGDKDKTIPDLKTVTTASKGRMLICISDYAAHDGLQIAPEELQGWLDRGYAGYKIGRGDRCKNT